VAFDLLRDALSAIFGLSELKAWDAKDALGYILDCTLKDLGNHSPMIALDHQRVRAQIRHSLHHYWLLEGVLSGFNLGKPNFKKPVPRLLDFRENQMGHNDEIVLAHVRTFTLEIRIEDIQILTIPPTPPRDTEPPVGSPIPSSPSSSVGSSSPVRSTTPPPDYPFDESIFAELDNSLWIIPRPLGSEPVPEEPNESDAC
ncbi:hypothetical protein Tco_0936809, partial [Tanacetum coccineum]